MNVQPSELKLLAPDRLQIAWSDGEVRQYAVRELRDKCPCATCTEKRSADQPAPLLQVLRVEETQPLRIAKMEPLGHYAYSIEFSDGHDTGLFTLEFLRTLGFIVDQP
ncbi:MAG: DUF971 domain-containing protein [Bythopirellula sp.]|nr:DUF971 domain-containing protein [Bythopirellula sp.]